MKENNDNPLGLGYIDASSDNTKIELDVVLNKFNLTTISPFGGNVIKRTNTQANENHCYE